MITKTTLPLPANISFLSFTIMGKTLRCFPSRRQEYTHYIALEDKHNGRFGLYLNPMKKTGAHLHSNYQDRFINGRVEHISLWDEHGETIQHNLTYDEWVRQETMKMIDKSLTWVVERQFKWKVRFEESDWKRMEKVLEEISNLPFFDFSQSISNGLLFETLASVYRIHKTRHYTQLDTNRIIRLLNTFDQATHHRQLRDQVEFVAFHFLPTPLPNDLHRFLVKKHSERINKFIGWFEAEQDSSEMHYFATQISRMPACIRSIYHELLCPIVFDTRLLHTIASAFVDFPEEQLCYLEKGLQLDPRNAPLLVCSMQTHTRLNQLSRAARFEAKLIELGIDSPSELCGSEDVQKWMERYTYLCNDFLHFNPKTNGDKTGPELVSLEARLNRHWLNLLARQSVMGCMRFHDVLLAQNRFLSAGSGAYLGWLRKKKRYAEAVDYTLEQTSNLQLCFYRHQTSAMRFEYTLSNGLSSFLASREVEHLTHAVAIVDRIETVIPVWQTGHFLYTLACVMARANQQDRALHYIRLALEKGERIKTMERDSDFENVRNHPGFIALKAS